MRTWRLLQVAWMPVVLPILLLGFAFQAHGAAPGPQDFSAPALSGLGDAWLRAGHPGRAILQYERALVLAPQDPALEQMLMHARRQAGISVVPTGPWGRAAGILTDDEWAWLGALSLLLLCGALALLVCGRGGRWARGLALMGACAVILATDVIVLHWPELDRAVVIRAAALARIAPADAAATSFELSEGEAVYFEARYHEFERIRTADGRGGWLRREDVLPVRVTAAEAAAEGLPP